MKTPILCLACIGLFSSGVAQAATFFVDSGGDDGNAGTQAFPFATVQRGVDAAEDSPGSDTVNIATGTYTENIVIDDPNPVTLVGTTGTTIDGDGGDVVEVLSGDVTLNDLVVTNGDEGILADSGSVHSLTLIDVQADNNGDEGLKAESLDTLTILRGSYSNNGDDGIDIEDIAVVTLIEVDAQDNGERGLESDDLTSAKIRGGNFSNNTEDGIKVDEALSVEIIGAESNGSDEGDGFDLEIVDRIHINGVNADGNDDEGLEVDFCQTIEVIYSGFDDNGDEGVDIDTTRRILVYGVNADSNTGAGLQVEAQDFEDVADGFDTAVVLVTDSDFDDNGGDGIKLTEGDGRVVRRAILDSVTANGNGESGLDVDISGKLTQTNVDTTGNTLPDDITTG